MLFVLLTLAAFPIAWYAHEFRIVHERRSLLGSLQEA
jgi:hypothetical protein